MPTLLAQGRRGLASAPTSGLSALLPETLLQAWPHFDANVTVTNTGDVAGDEVVQVYLQPPQMGLSSPLRSQIVAFQRVSLQPGQSADLHFPVYGWEFASQVSLTDSPSVVPGKWTLQVSNGHELLRELTVDVTM